MTDLGWEATICNPIGTLIVAVSRIGKTIASNVLQLASMNSLFGVASMSTARQIFTLSVVGSFVDNF